MWLPGVITSENELPAPEIYRLFALRLAARIERGGVSFVAQATDPLCADIFLLLEAFSADQDLQKKLPGVRQSLHRFYQQTTRLRPPLPSFSATRRPLETFYRSLLSGEAEIYTSTPAESLSKAQQLLHEFSPYSVRGWST